MYDKAYTLKSWEQTCTEAESITAQTGVVYLPCDLGEYVSPRYDIVKAPKIGDKVSKALNGDCYPVGVITGVSKSFRVVRTSFGLTFYRRKQSRSWLNTGVWTLVQGHIDERNPSF